MNARNHRSYQEGLEEDYSTSEMGICIRDVSLEEAISEPSFDYSWKLARKDRHLYYGTHCSML